MTINPLAFVFPGQGSQKVGMLADAANEFPCVNEAFVEASDVLGYDLWQLIQSGPQEELNLTERTQPMLLTASVALWRAWLQQGGQAPEFMAGHSLGEWSALVCADVVSLPDAVKLVQLRGKFMQEAVPEGQGSMAAIIGLDDDVVTDVCLAVAEGEVVSPVNFNSPGQVVIAGDVAAVDRACLLAKEKGAKKAMPLAVSAPFHSSLLKPAAEKLKPYIDETIFNRPSISIVHNVNASIDPDPEAIKQAMIEQIYKPVLWVGCVNGLVKLGVNTCVECGPGKVLSGLAKRIDRSITSLTIEAPSDLSKALSTVEESGKD